MARPKWQTKKGGTLSNVEQPERVAAGTFRYLAPEILSCRNKQEVAELSFESFQESDVFSFGTVIWEMTYRTKFRKYIRSHKMPWSTSVHEYTLAFQDVSPQANHQQMRRLVVEQQKRPKLLPEWRNNPIAAGMQEVMNACWSQRPEERSTSNEVRGQLLRLSRSMHE